MHDPAAFSGAMAEVVRQRRKQLGLTQAEVAELAGLAVRTVHAVEAGKSTLRLDALLAVVDVVGLQLQLTRRTGESGR